MRNVRVGFRRFLPLLLYMLHVLTPQGSKAIDAACIEQGISGAELMETAATNAADVVRQRVKPGAHLLIACGGGNNGGDGFAMAHLLADTYDVQVVSDADPETMSPEARDHAIKAREMVRVIDWAELDPRAEYGVIIDALIGVGGSARLRDPLPERLRILNAFNALRIAIDVPTGLDGLTGAVHDNVFRADLTITMEGAKAGFYAVKARPAVGEVVVVPIGAPSQVTATQSVAQVLEDADIKRLLPSRPLNVNKFDVGRVLVIGGSLGMRGAPSMTSEAVLRSGAGLCILATPSVHPLTPREVMTEVLPMTPEGWMSTDARGQLQAQLSNASVVAVGPGLGTDGTMQRMLADLLNHLDPAVPLVIDADGLRLVPMLQRDMSHVILTPHEGEFRRLVDALPTHADRPMVHPADVATALGCIVHRKGVPSVTTDGRNATWTVVGNPGMATAGSGDVLTGIIAGLAAQGLAPFRAAALGAYLHARAGDIAAEATAEEFVIAGDIIRALADLF